MASDSKIDEVVNEIYRRIREGIYKPGQRLPAERDLAKEMNISGQTMRTAIKRLQAENAIYTIPRSGIFISGQRPISEIGPLAPLLIRKKSDAERAHILENPEKEMSYHFRRSSFSVAEGDIARKMNIKEEIHFTGNKTQVMREYSIYSMNEIPYRIIDNYYSVPLLAEFPEYNENPFQWLRKYVKQSTSAPEAFERMKCRMPNENEMDFLNINRNQPVFDIERWVVVKGDLFLMMKGDKVFAYTQIIANAALHEFTYAYNTANWEDFFDKMLVDK